MGNEVEIRIDAAPKAGLDVYFWQNDQRSKVVYLDGGEEEVQVKDSFITESLCAWAKLILQQTAESEKDKAEWIVVYKSNTVGGEIFVALEKVKQKIEMAIQKGIEVQIDITDDLKVPGWTVVGIRH